MTQAWRILVLDRDNIGHDLDWSILAGQGELIIRDQTPANEMGPVLAAAQAAIVVCNRPIFEPEILRQAALSGLQLICLTATGTNTVDLPTALANGIAVCNIVGYSTESVAQHTFALALELINRPAHYNTYSRSWRAGAPTKATGKSAWTSLDWGIHELAGRTWGVIGMGAIGRRVAAIAAAFGCRVIWASTGDSLRQEAWPQVPLRQLLMESDIVSIHSPITETSRNLIGSRELSMMKKTALLINVGRGGIVNERDLAAGLAAGTIAGAGLDVLWPEPPAVNNPLLELPDDGRLILTPHIAWAAVEARQRALAESAANIIAWKQGIKRNRVD